MKKSFAFVSLVFLFAVSSTFATDYAVDSGFNPQFADFYGCGSGNISDVYVQPDGKIVVAGKFALLEGQPARWIARLNPDGTRDSTFNSGLTQPSLNPPCVKRIRPLPDGKFIVVGNFNALGQHTEYARLNADGSVDASMSNLLPAASDMIRLPDGKSIVCSGRMVNGETYWLANRLNADGSVDPTYRITAFTGTCVSIELVEDGKIMMAGYFYGSGNVQFPWLQRFNPDGSHDPTFQLQYAYPPNLGFHTNFAVGPDGKITLAYVGGPTGRVVQRVTSNGQLDLVYPNCVGLGILPETDGTAIISDCRKFPQGPGYGFADIGADGRIVPDMDPFPSSNFPSVLGFANAGGGAYYVFGNGGSLGEVPHNGIARVVARASQPRRAKFDFDGDRKTDYVVWRPSDRFWYMWRSSAGPAYLQWGLSTDLLAAGDYNADGTTEVAIFRDGLWYINSPTGLTFRFLGRAGDKPMLGYLGAGDRPVIFVRRTEGSSVTRRGEITGGSIDGYLISSIEGEVPTDVPVVGDFDGDSREEIGYFHDGVWVTQDYGSATTKVSFAWGVAGDIPVPEDYDGDAQTDYAIYRPSTGTWWIRLSSGSMLVVRFGLSGDIPVPADYDGDGKADIAIYRDGQWWQMFSSTGGISVVNWGIAGDKPIPAQAR